MKLFQLTRKGLFLVALLGVSPTMTRARSPREELTPSQRLIYAVKGVKLGTALMAGMLNPLFGLAVAAYQPDESANDISRIDQLLKEGADIDYQEEYYQYTPLIYAAYGGYPKIAAHLISKGAHVNITEKDGYNAYTMAKYYFDRYSTFYSANEEKIISSTYTPEDKQRMRKYYWDLISRYKQIVEMLEPLT